MWLPRKAHAPYRRALDPGLAGTPDAKVPAARVTMGARRTHPGPEDPVISIVMPAHNEASMLEASVRDVVNGMRANGSTFEVRVVENGSTDGTMTIATRLAEQMPEVTASTMRAADY